MLCGIIVVHKRAAHLCKPVRLEDHREREVARYLISLDLGTSACKAGLFDVEGNLLRLARCAVPVYHPFEAWAEQSPDDWWAAACEALRELMSGEAKPEDVAGVGLSGQTPGHVLVDSRGEPVGRAIIWQDRRATAEAELISETFTSEELTVHTGLTFVPDSASPPARLLWLRDHDPNWERARWVLQPKDYLAFRLTGNPTTDRSSAYGLAHLSTGLYDPAYFSRLNLPPDRLPPVCMATSCIGTVTPTAARETRLATGMSVFSGTIDAWCGIVGAGGAAGQGVDIAGTSEVVALITSTITPVSGLTHMELAGDLNVVIGPTQLGADAVSWVRRVFYPEVEETDYASIENEVASVAPGSGGLVFLPYLLGERAPIWDDQARGAFLGCRIEHRRPHFARAAYEGGAFAIRHILSLAESSANCEATELRVGGGGSRSDVWNQIKADVTGKRVARLKVAETSVLGAAIWAAVGLGLYPDAVTAGEAMTTVRRWYQPDEFAAERYDGLFPAYLDGYPALRDILHRVSRWSSESDKPIGDRE